MGSISTIGNQSETQPVQGQTWDQRVKVEAIDHMKRGVRLRKLAETPMSRFLVAVLLLLLSRSAAGETIELRCQGGVCLVPVRINDAITLNFLLDSGASDVMLPADVFLTLTRTGTVKTSDFIGTMRTTLADGSTQSVKRVLLHELRVGGQVVRNVTAGVLPVKGAPLLGQSFLSNLPAWTIDNQRHVLVLNDAPSAIGGQQRAALPPPQTLPPAPVPSAESDSRLSPGELRERAREPSAEIPSGQNSDADKITIEKFANYYLPVAKTFGCKEFAWGSFLKNHQLITLEYVPEGDDVNRLRKNSTILGNLIELLPGMPVLLVS